MDWLFEIDNNICDLRVAGILIKNNKIVVQRDKRKRICDTGWACQNRRNHRRSAYS